MYIQFTRHIPSVQVNTVRLKMVLSLKKKKQNKTKSVNDKRKSLYYMTSSVSGQDELNPALAVIGCPRGQDGTILPARDFLFCSRPNECTKVFFRKYFP